MATSGTYTFDPALVDIVLDAFDRIQIRPSAITPDHMLSARRSLNQLFVRFSNNQVNLWKVDEQTVLLNEGQGEYDVPGSTISMLETWIRSYQMNALESLTVACSTEDGSDQVVVGMADHGMVVGNYCTIPIYVAVGGVIVQGTYQVVEVPSADEFTIEVDSNATSTVADGGAVPVYDTTVDLDTITVTLTAHGFVPGDTYTVHVLTEVGGLQLQGDYTILATPTADTLTFTASSAAASTDSVSENDGEMQVGAQNPDAFPQDRMLMPISRTDWAAIPNKTQTGGYPTSYWFDRTVSPTVNVWLVPDGTIVSELHYFRVAQLQDANPQGTETADVPYRFQEAVCAGLTYMLAMKWKPEAAEALKAYFGEVWSEAMKEDRERVILNLSPQYGAYFQ